MHRGEKRTLCTVVVNALLVLQHATACHANNTPHVRRETVTLSQHSDQSEKIKPRMKSKRKRNAPQKCIDAFIFAGQSNMLGSSITPELLLPGMLSTEYVNHTRNWHMHIPLIHYLVWQMSTGLAAQSWNAKKCNQWALCTHSPQVMLMHASCTLQIGTFEGVLVWCSLKKECSACDCVSVGVLVLCFAFALML